MKKSLIIPLLLGLTWTILLATLFAWSVAGERRHIMALAEGQAKAFFKQITATRAWNSAYGGVFVPLGHAEPNPYLPENERLLRAESGLTLVRVNPAYMTRQIAEYAQDRDGVVFRITSLNPTRQENAPDPWERAVLKSLGPQNDHFELLHLSDGRKIFRYMAPLITEASCLSCHPGETAGSVRGGIDVSVPADPLLSYLDDNLQKHATAYGIIWLAGLLGLGGFTFEAGRKRELAEQLSSTKSRFLANMSHDMRTPLTSILGLSERILRQDPGQRAAHFTKLIIHSAKSLLEIVGDILDFARLDSGRLELAPRPFDPARAIRRAANVFSFAAEEKGLEFSYAVPPDLPKVLIGDEFRYRQVLSNLLGNAIKYTGSGFVRVSVAATAQADGTCLLATEVADSGVGIAAADLESIFESFSQAGGDLARRHAGSGLGLSISRQLARLMGGDVTVTSVPGQGSRFVFTAALQTAGAAEEPAEDDAGDVPGLLCQSAALAGRKVLVADDHGVIRALLSDILREDGAEVRLACDGREALSLTGRERFDLILMDLQMPGLSGVETLLRLREIERDKESGRTPVILLTAFSAPEEVVELPKGAFEGLVLKPIDLTLLRQAMLAALTKRPNESRKDPGRAAPDGEPAAGPAPLATAEALKLLNGRRDLYRMLAEEFMACREELRIGFEEALARGDAREAARFAHTIKTDAAALGALGLRDLAAALEARIKAGEPLSGFSPRPLQVQFALTVEALDQALAGER